MGPSLALIARSRSGLRATGLSILDRHLPRLGRGHLRNLRSMLGLSDRARSRLAGLLLAATRAAWRRFRPKSLGVDRRPDPPRSRRCRHVRSRSRRRRVPQSEDVARPMRLAARLSDRSFTAVGCCSGPRESARPAPARTAERRAASSHAAHLPDPGESPPSWPAGRRFPPQRRRPVRGTQGWGELAPTRDFPEP